MKHIINLRFIKEISVSINDGNLGHNNGVAPPIMNSLFEFRSNEYNIRNFQVLSTDFRRASNYGIEIVTYRAPSLWAKLPSKYKFAASLEELEMKMRHMFLQIMQKHVNLLIRIMVLRYENLLCFSTFFKKIRNLIPKKL